MISALSWVAVVTVAEPECCLRAEAICRERCLPTWPWLDTDSSICMADLQHLHQQRALGDICCPEHQHEDQVRYVCSAEGNSSSQIMQPCSSYTF